MPGYRRLGSRVSANIVEVAVSWPRCLLLPSLSNMSVSLIPSSALVQYL